MVFDDTNLPSSICDDITNKYSSCIANVWATGGDHMVEFSDSVCYPIGGEDAVKYFMIQIHFDNSQLSSNRYDKSGIRYYIGNELRQYDLGFLTFGTHASPGAIAIPPGVNEFINVPEEGITVISAFPHTYLQGKSVSTKIIRNNRAVEYLFNAESYNFNYQFENRLSKPIKLYKNDSFITRCIYQTMNKDEITLVLNTNSLSISLDDAF